MNGIEGKRERFRCPSCRKKFVYWRPEALPGVKVKCYFCGVEFEDDAARRQTAPPPAPPPAPDPEPPKAAASE
ncbi:MAG: hypothetical protein ACRD16_01240 [Thermoanaerobaculia bacterium]